MKIEFISTGSKGNCTIITSDDKVLIIDCGIPYKQVIGKIKGSVASIEAVLVTHEHKDHSKAVEDMAKRSFPLHMSKGTAEALSLEENDYSLMKHGKQFSTNTFTILPFTTEHDTVESLGFLIVCEDYKILFATDTVSINYDFPGITHAIIEGSYEVGIMLQIKDESIVKLQRNIDSHLSCDNLVEYINSIDKSKLSEIFVIHTSFGLVGRNLAKRISRNTLRPTTIITNGFVYDTEPF